MGNFTCFLYPGLIFVLEDEKNGSKLPPPAPAELHETDGCYGCDGACEPARTCCAWQGCCQRAEAAADGVVSVLEHWEEDEAVSFASFVGERWVDGRKGEEEEAEDQHACGRAPCAPPQLVSDSAAEACRVYPCCAVHGCAPGPPDAARIRAFHRRGPPLQGPTIGRTDR